MRFLVADIVRGLDPQMFPLVTSPVGRLDEKFPSARDGLLIFLEMGF